MHITVIAANQQYINFDTDVTNVFRLDSQLFQFIEKLWWEWFEDEKEHNNQIEDMYFSDDAVFDKKGAIRQGIEQLIEVAEEQNKILFTEAEMHTVVDISCAFS